MTGTRIGNYRIVRPLGQGGMGSVYEAMNEQIGRRVAIKVLHRMFQKDPEVTTRFFNEARATNLVQHAGILDIHEFGQTEDGVPYIVMEYLAGEPLANRLARRFRYPNADILRLGRRIASALAAAHGSGVVHRDLKPANVMIVPDPETPGGERVKILDFGIAKLALDASGAGGPCHQTQAGALMGTPAYMAPEQCRGAAGVDHKADVYSLGVILYEMLAGQVPFFAEGLGELMLLHMFQEPRPLAQLNPSVAPEVAALVHGMLAKAPEARPTTGQVANELWRLGEGQVQGPGTAMLATGYWPGTASMALLSAAVPGGRSTLGGAVGQRPAPRSNPRAGLGAALALLLPALLAIGDVTPIARDRASAAPSAATAGSMTPARPAAAPHRVRWSVRSTPAGAEVVRVADGKVLGVTPLALRRSMGEGEIGVILRLPGFVDRRIALPLWRDFSSDEVLVEPPGGPPEKRRRKHEAATAGDPVQESAEVANADRDG